ncbi:MAG: hypothetical protein KKE79_05365 [Actinobacteria bacterium]|nr:hypothetical protein [Actinomycetota bacterium]
MSLPSEGLRNARGGIRFFAVVVMLCLCASSISCLGKISLENYLCDLDTIRSSSDKSFAQIQKALEDLKSGPEALKALFGEISEAEEELETCVEALRELKPPKQAKKLNSIVLELYGEAWAFFSDMKSMLTYTVEREPLIAKVEAASLSLDSRIAGDPSPANVGAALADTATEVDAVASDLEELSPPSFLEGIHTALLEMLGDYSSSLLDLKSAVESSDIAGINQAQARVREALSGNLAEETRKSIEAYNARIDRIEELREEANEEETRITGGDK